MYDLQCSACVKGQCVWGIGLLRGNFSCQAALRDLRDITGFIPSPKPALKSRENVFIMLSLTDGKGQKLINLSSAARCLA